MSKACIVIKNICTNYVTCLRKWSSLQFTVMKEKMDLIFNTITAKFTYSVKIISCDVTTHLILCDTLIFPVTLLYVYPSIYLFLFLLIMSTYYVIKDWFIQRRCVRFRVSHKTFRIFTIKNSSKNMKNEHWRSTEMHPNSKEKNNNRSTSLYYSFVS